MLSAYSWQCYVGPSCSVCKVGRLRFYTIFLSVDVFGRGFEECVDKCVYVIREVGDELNCDRVWFGCLSGWDAIDCPIVVAV